MNRSILRLALSGPVALLVASLAARSLSAAETETYTFSSIDMVGWIEPSSLEASGELVGTKTDAVLLSEGMEVYCKFGAAPQLDEQYLIVRMGSKKVEDPISGTDLGYRVDALGTLTVVAEEAGSFRAKITKSYAEIYRGDKLVPFAKGNDRVEITKNYANIEGVVVSSLDYSKIFGQTQVVFVDKGTDHGLAVGNKLNIYRPAHEVDDLSKDAPLPDMVYGEMLVIKAGNQTSAAVILKSNDRVTVGARFRTVLE